MKKGVALVLSGGGARGIAHIGIIEELEKQGFEIKSIAGTSMGALVGAVYSIGKMNEFKNWICTLDKLEVFRLIDFTLSAQGLSKGDKVFKKIREFISDVNIEDLKIHFAATATDIKNGKEVVFTKGSIYDAIRASIAIPTVITPIISENEILVDGGVMNNLPTNHVKRSENDILITSYVNANIPIILPPSSQKVDNKAIVFLKDSFIFSSFLNSLSFNSSLFLILFMTFSEVFTLGKSESLIRRMHESNKALSSCWIGIFVVSII